MNQTAAVRSLDTPPLVSLLESLFSDPELAALLGEAGTGVPTGLWERSLLGPARDILSRPGKEFRARFVETSWELGGGRPGSCPSGLMALVELLHAGSLVVDDIEDDSEVRRGAPTLHRIHGVPVALNTGNWLYFVSLSLIDRLGLEAEPCLRLHRAAARALVRCHHGQALDLTARVTELSQPDVSAVVSATTRLKTGGLMELAAELGAIAAGAEAQRRQALVRFGGELGVGLQMLDDLAGIRNESRHHKADEDLRLGRPTWAWAWAAERLEPSSYRRLQRMAVAVVEEGAEPAALRRALARDLGSGSAVGIRRHLAAAVRELERALGPSSVLAAVEAEVARLERSFLTPSR